VLAGIPGPVHGTNHLTALEQSTTDAAAWGWCDVTAMERHLSKLGGSTQAGGILKNPLKSLALATGFSGADALKFTLRTNAAGVLFDARLHLSKTDPTDLSGLFSKHSGAGIPSFVPENAERFQQWHFAGNQLWATIETTLGRISGQAMRGLDFLLETAEIAAQMKKPQFNLRTNLTTSIGDTLCYWQQPGTNSQDGLEKILVFSSRSPEELAYTLKSMLVLVSAEAEKPQERDFQGRKVFSVALPPANLAGLFTIPKNTTLHYAYTTQYVAIATGPNILEEFLSRSAKPSPGLAERETITRGVATLMPSPALLHYQNDGTVLRKNWPIVQGNPEHLFELLLPEPLPVLLRPLLSQKAVGEILRAGTIPPFSEIERGFSFHLNAAGFEADELLFQTFLPYVQ
jgi:hypothetical protein